MVPETQLLSGTVLGLDSAAPSFDAEPDTLPAAATPRESSRTACGPCLFTLGAVVSRLRAAVLEHAASGCGYLRTHVRSACADGGGAADQSGRAGRATGAAALRVITRGPRVASPGRPTTIGTDPERGAHAAATRRRVLAAPAATRSSCARARSLARRTSRSSALPRAPATARVSNATPSIAAGSLADRTATPATALAE